MSPFTIRPLTWMALAAISITGLGMLRLKHRQRQADTLGAQPNRWPMRQQADERRADGPPLPASDAAVYADAAERDASA